MLVAVVGPSGAGKDSVLRGLQAALAHQPQFAFARRCITRPADTHEDHEPLSSAEFARLQGEGAFALSWQAHGLSYAIHSRDLAASQAGRIIIANLSRAVISEARRVFGDVCVVAITADNQTRAMRLAARGRESAEAIAERLAREVAVEADHTIDNSGALEGAVRELSELMLRLAKAPVS